jgi:hypothetical protein
MSNEKEVALDKHAIMHCSMEIEISRYIVSYKILSGRSSHYCSECCCPSGGHS